MTRFSGDTSGPRMLSNIESSGLRCNMPVRAIFTRSFYPTTAEVVLNEGMQASHAMSTPTAIELKVVTEIVQDEDLDEVRSK